MRCCLSLPGKLGATTGSEFTSQQLRGKEVRKSSTGWARRAQEAPPPFLQSLFCSESRTLHCTAGFEKKAEQTFKCGESEGECQKLLHLAKTVETSLRMIESMPQIHQRNYVSHSNLKITSTENRIDRTILDLSDNSMQHRPLWEF